MIIKKHLLLLIFFLVLVLAPMRPIYVYGAENESLKQSAINMMEAILNITNSDGVVTQPERPTIQPTQPIDDENNNTVPTVQPNITLPPSTNSKQKDCPSTGKLIISSSQYSHLNKYLPCDKPRMIVVHWSAGWSSAKATFDTLNVRDRSCQFAIDENTTIQMLDHYSKQMPDHSNLVERGWCAGGDSNVGSINFEITGAWFDSVLDNPNSNKKRFKDLMIMTDKTVALTCRFMQMYDIPITAIYGHYQLQKGKADPGVNYLQFFKDEVNKAC